MESPELGNTACTGAPLKLWGSKLMLAGMIAVNAVREAFWLAVENRASVGGRSKYGAITIISVTTINSNPTNLAQCFTATTLNILCHAAFRLSNTEKLTSLALYGWNERTAIEPGERITGCSPLLGRGSDRIPEELVNCHRCLSPHASSDCRHGFVRIAAPCYLCAHHLAEAARTFPELQPQSA